MSPSLSPESPVVVITGAASGIGAALARLFALDGARAVLLDVNADVLEKTGREIASETGRPVYSAVADVGDYKAFEKAVAEAADTLGPIHIFVNNAGIGISGDFLNNSVEEIQRITAVNYLGMVYGSKIACSRFAAQGFGHLVNVASVAGLQGFPRMSLYCGAKGGIVAFTQALRFEMRRMGIHVSLALPSTTDTPMITDNLDPEDGSADVPGILLAIPMCKTEDVALAIHRGIQKKKFLIFPTATDRGALFMRNYAQGAFNLFIRSVGFRPFLKRRRKIAEARKEAVPSQSQES